MIGRIIKAFRNAYSGPVRSLRDVDAFSADVLDGRAVSSGVTVNSRTVLGYPAFWRGVNIIANVCAKLPLYVRQVNDDGGKPIDRQHPAYPLLNRKANPFMSASTFQRTLTLHAQMHGNGYAWIDRNNRGLPVELMVLDPQQTFPVKFRPKDAMKWEVWYVTKIEGQEVRIPASDVLHIRHLSTDGLIGISVVDIMRESLGLGMAVRQFGARFFGEGANAGGVLMIPGHLKPEAQKNLLAYWSKMASGMKNSHRVALIQDGAKFERTTFAPDEAQFLETKRFEIIEISNIIGIPPHKLGDSSRAAYNSIEAENRNALEESYDPWLCTWEEECEAKLLTEEQQRSESHIVEYDRSLMVRTTWAERANGYRVYREMGVMSANDVCRAEGRETIGPDGDIRHIPANWVRSDAAPDEAEADDNQQGSV